MSPIIASALLQSTFARLGIPTGKLRDSDLPAILDQLERGLGYYLRPAEVRAALAGLRRLLAPRAPSSVSPREHLIAISDEVAVREARIAALQIARSAGFDHPDATKVATVVSELARNILQYAGQGSLQIEPLDAPRRGVRVNARDQGPGIAELDAVLAGTYRSSTGLGLGLKGSRLIMDIFEVDSAPGKGTSITAVKYV